MKTFEEFIQEMAGVTLSLSVMLPVLTPKGVEKSAQAYARYIALEAMKADRERVAEKAKTTRSCSVWNCEGESVDKESILNLPYELK